LDSQANNEYEKLEFDFGETALKTAITSKEGSRCANYSIGTDPEIVTKNKKNRVLSKRWFIPMNLR
jgi:hypothetical protein